jgi:pimeloyl-ACP methyl ester carboxylesterase
MWGAGSISRYSQTLPSLHASVILPDVGHWMQQEDAPGVNAALLDFLGSI